MRAIDRMLLPDEQIIFRTGKHLIIFLTPIMWLAITIAIKVTYTASPSINQYFPRLPQFLVLIPLLLALWTGAAQALLYLSSEYAVTNKRVLMREGILLRRISELRLATVSNMRVNQSLAGQLLGYATLIISPFGNEEDVFTEIAQPFEFQRATQTQLDKVTR